MSAVPVSVPGMSEHAIQPILLDAFDYVVSRLQERLADMTRAEYLWRPVSDSWSLVETADGRWMVERPHPEPMPPPVTTIAWRTWHIASDCLAGYIEQDGGAWPLGVTGREWHDEPAQAATAVGQAYAAFRLYVVSLGEERLWQPLGQAWGPYAADSWASLVLHAFDEVVHHGAEIGLLRDLFLRHHALDQSVAGGTSFGS